MSSGRRQIVINTQERAVSTDINRLQAFASAEEQEVLRHLLSFRHGDELYPGTVTVPSGTGTPLRAEILGGLMVRPALASFEVLVDAGILVAVTGDGLGADDSSYKYIRSVGVPAATLSIGANVSGSIRIDVIECSIDSTPDSVSDNRDIFNASTGLFTAQSVTKEQKARLAFRIRQGTPGSGYPTAQAGWLPLCIASVPSGATSNDNVTFWDVRPLASDRERYAFLQEPLGSSAGSIGEIYSVNGMVDRVSSTDVRFSGFFSGNFRGRRIGGTVRRCSPGTDTDYVNVADNANQAGAGGLAEPLSDPLYVYACFPKGLPRWAMYAPASAGARIPRGPSGILVTTDFKPNIFGRSTSGGGGVGLPNATGLGGSATSDEALCVLTLLPASGGNFMEAYADHREIRYAISTAAIVSSAFASARWEFFLNDSDWPPNAKFLDVIIEGSVDVPANSESHIRLDISVYADGVSTTPLGRVLGPSLSFTSDGSPETFNFSVPVRLPAAILHPTAANLTHLVRVAPGIASAFGTIGTASTNANMYVYGVVQ